MKNKQPIAIVGMACRFPGGCHNTEQYWTLLQAGRDVITEIRPDRWSRDFYYHPDPKSSGKTYTAAAGQLDNIYHFDAGFFGISPREAAQMDPQQRLLLQMAWEAVEDAGVSPRDIAGSHCSVYTGVSSLDYANNRMDDPNVADAYFMTGNTLSIAANRISYFFDLHGPSMTIDTACSSSLVALHQACTSIWSGESSGSIVGAVHLVLSPFPFIGFSKASMLSRLGRCSVFDAAADGYVRSEGGVVLYLKPLEQAVRDGNTIHALIRGTGVNSDGNTSAMTVPNGAAQATLLQALYSGSGIDINDIDYIEAHGTGTPVGDPIEAAALGRAVGERRSPANPLLIGSVKTNIGHLEPASGFAGLLKVVLSLKHRSLPATIHQNHPNPQIDFEHLNLRVVNRNTGLPVLDRPLIMGVNSFGFGGTNAHTILEEYRRPAQPGIDLPTGDSVPLPPLFLSAMSEASLKKRAAQFLSLLAAPLTDRQLYDIFYTAACRRQRMNFGLVATGPTVDVIRQALADYIEGKKSACLFRVDPQPRGTVAWVFSGNGSQWPGMGRGLLAAPVFRDTIERIDAIFRPLAGWSLLDELQAEPAPARLEATEVAQPLLFAVQAGIVSLLRQMGVQADAVTGHSVGEIAAAYACGSLTLDDAVRVIYFRSAAQGRTRGRGRMAAIRLSAEAVQPMLEDSRGEIGIAAFNAPGSITVSGHTGAIRSLIEQLQEQAVTCRELDLDYAFHSAVMDDVEQYIKENLRTIVPVAGTTEFVSTVSGTALAGEELNADYWWRNIREPVQFGPAIAGLVDRGVTTFIEIGAHPVLQSYMREVLQSRSVSGNVLRTVKRNDTDERLSVRAAALKALFSNAENKLDSLFPLPGQLMALPAYPWDESPYLFTGSNEAINRRREHPLLGYRLNAVEGIWINQIDTATHPWLADHVVDGVVIFPAAGFVEMALAASHSGLGHEAGSISSIEIRKPLILEPGKTRVVQFQLSGRDMQFSIRSRDRLSDMSWTEHANGRLGQGIAAAPQRSMNIQRPAAAGRQVSREQIYAAAADHGLEYGAAFQGAASVSMDEEALLTTLVLPPAVAGKESGQYLWHPVLMDSAFHALFACLIGSDISSGNPCPYVPVEMSDIRYQGHGVRDIAYSECRLYKVTSNLIRAAFVFYDRSGVETAAIRHCLFRKLPRHDRQKGRPLFYRYTRVPKNLVNPCTVSPLPAINEFVDSIHRLEGRDVLVAEEKVQSEQVVPLLDALASAIAEQTLREFGAHLGYFTVESLMAASRIPENYQPLLACLLDILEQDGKVIHHDSQWKLLDAEEPDDPAAIWRSILADYPACIGVLRHTLNNSLRIRQILSGSQATGAQVETGSHLPAPSGLQQALLQQVFAHICTTWPRSGRRLRIAEVRSHPAAVPGTFVPSLPPSFCDYEILALSDAVALQAEELYADHVNVSVTRIELSRSALQPTYQEGEFDIVLVFGDLNCHGSAGETLTQIAWLLASGGLLLMSERPPARITDLNRALADPEGGYRQGPAVRPHSGQLEPEDWTYLLENAGFEDVRDLVDLLYRPASCSLFAARRAPRQMIEAEANKYAAQAVVMLIAAAEGYSCELARALVDELSKDGIRTLMVTDRATGPGPHDAVSLDLSGGAAREQLEGIIAPHNAQPLSILYLGALNDRPGEASSTDTADQITACNMRLLNLFKSLSGVELKNKPVVRVITRGAAGGYSSELPWESNPYQAGLWGLGRVIRNEYPDMDCRMIDLQQAGSPRQVSRLLVREISSGDGEEEVVFVDSARMVMRLDVVESDIRDSRADASAGLPGANTGFHLAFSRAGSIDNLEWHENDRGLPGTEQVEIEVRAAGLNFRDIMFTSGLLPPEMLEDGHSGATLGLECAGVITRIGPSVSSFSVGDEVIAMAPACFASHVIVSKYSVIRKPAGWSFEAAATVPTAFFTVYYALNYMARLKPGERVLIHGATGGVGLAAIQYARYCGAEIFATAGSPEKRRFLKLLGVEHVLNSRTLDFADRIMAITAGEGVDVVLNSLAGEAMSKNFSVIRPFGRFIELGKRDFFENTKLDLKPFRNNITYYGVDADQLLSHEPELSRQLMAEVFGLFNDGVFRPLPYTSFPYADIKGAFRYMQQSKHIGKVVVCNRGDGLRIRVAPPADALELDAGRTYLVTGGLSGFGLATARWLADKGARHLVLAGRSGLLSAEAEQVIEALTMQQVDVRVVRCDVTDAIRLQTLLNEIQQSAFPLKGIIHSAMVLEDAAIRNMDAEKMRSVVAPKVQGAWNLHRLTLNYDLDMFVLYSSATTCIGNPGQSNYVAANTFVEALARTRRLAGLPATVIAWDAITDTGYLARNEQLAGRMTRKLGLAGITSSQALEALEHLLVSGSTETIVMNANWSSLRQVLPILNSNLFRNIMHLLAVDRELDSDDLVDLLATLPQEEKQPVIVAFLIREIARILQTPEEKIAHNGTIQDLGVDSLMAMELANTIETRLGVNLPVIILADNITIDNLAFRIIELLSPESATAENRVTDMVGSLARIHAEEMSTEEIASLSEAVNAVEQKTIRLIQ